jgi:hypothetical protein
MYSLRLDSVQSAVGKIPTNQRITKDNKPRACRGLVYNVLNERRSIVVISRLHSLCAGEFSRQRLRIMDENR